jgi:dihydrolipoamide dehydrogenase
MKREKYDVVIIGAGPGGHAVAEGVARAGKSVAIIERNGWGGTCTHRGCIPTKALLACSRQLTNLKKLKRLGVLIGEPTFDFASMKRHQKQMVAISALGVQKSLKDVGVHIKAGFGKIMSPGEVEWTSPEGDIGHLEAENIVIAWGSETLLLPGVTLSERILTSDGFLTLDVLPKSVIIVGGSVIGVEFATFLAELGVHVTIIELLDRLIPQEEEEATDLLKQELTRLGVTLYTGAKAETLEDRSGDVHLIASQGANQFDLTADYALICTGRKPLLHGEELERCGIAWHPKGIVVNEHQMTNIAGIYAIGDVTGGMMLAHRAIQQGKALAGYLCGDVSFTCTEKAIPSVVYSHPNVARVGLTEREALEKGLTIEIRKADYAANIIARSELKGNGFIKAVFCKEKLIGVTIAGEDASELIASMSLAVANSLSRKELKQWILPHPTLSEIFYCLT